jgi:LPS O-antigen subunit length determinant protein (WzzB/FepE family)
MVISPGQVAVRVSPDWKLNLAKSGLIGVVLGIFVVGVQAFVMKSKD